MIAEPPSSAGAVHETDAELTPSVAVTPVGASGTECVVVDAEAAEAELVPTMFRATTVNV